MSIELKTKYGQIDISNDVIATIAGGAAVDCYGIVGMASKNQIKDGLTDILRRENFTRGVIVRQENEEVHIDMYIIVSYGTKISEVAHNVQSKVKYTLDKTVGLAVDSVNIYVQGSSCNEPVRGGKICVY
ncbi:Asp23/Gls24 family envelope stress response protein [Mesobacillus subterraneus]|nr:Asp23/Gls24 family envelope stress response protein [Mesobacillus subterraneus]WLR53472.1 Asp23/Gls24 family envelope stress response protein [Mesobacillus subterraneus]